MSDLEMYMQSDPEFRQEMLSLFIKNLIEFRGSIVNALNQNDALLFFKAQHKIKTTICFSGSTELQHHIDLIIEKFKEKGGLGIDAFMVDSFNKQCTILINELELRLATIKKAL